MLLRVLLYIFALVATPSFADTVWLKNGDRLSGKITLFDGGKVLIQTEYAGAVPIDWKQVKTLESDQELLVKQGGYIGEKAKSLKAAEDGEVTLAEGNTLKTVELKSIYQIMKPASMTEGVTWKGNIDVALDYKRDEKDADKYDIDYKITVRDGLWRHVTKGEYNRELQGGVASSDNWNVSYALDRFLTERFYWQGRLFYLRDKVDSPVLQVAEAAGPGYQFWDDELGAFSLNVLLARIDYKLKDGYKGNEYFVAMGWDYNRYLIGKRFEFFASGEIQRPLAGELEYQMHAETGLRYKITDWGSLNLKAEHTFVNVPDEGNFTTTRYTAGFGVNW